jgi:hypothetical protein
MIRLILLLGIILFAFFIIRKFLSTPAQEITNIIKKIGGVLLIIGIILLVTTGKLNGLIAVAGILVAFFVKQIPYILRYFPQLYSVWMMINKGNQQQPGYRKTSAKSKNMSEDEARDVLGITSSASKEEIIMAHRKLMQKMHPDRGGSNYLAAKINQAKKVLLQK